MRKRLSYKGLLVALAVAGATVSPCPASASRPDGKGLTLTADLKSFGFSTTDTLLTLDCNEYVAQGNVELFYGDFRSALEINAKVQCNTSLTEQSFICKEGVRGELYADLTIGFDPGPEKIFAEVKDSAGTLHRIFAGDNLRMGEWCDVQVVALYDERSGKSEMTLTVSRAEGVADSATETYTGYALPYNASRWVIGRGYPGGFPNSLQVRKGALKDLTISGTGLLRQPGENPLITDRFSADPAALVVGDRIYLYVGEDCATPGGWFTMPHWVAYSSADMINWECHGPVLRAADFPHANPNGAWAAQVVEKAGKYYFYVTLDDVRNGKHMIEVAVGDGPLGPFTPVTEGSRPLITDDMTPDSHRANADIDPTVLIDGGEAWIAWGNGDCYMARLSDDMKNLDSEIFHVGLRNYSEGPWLFKRGDLYYLVYAADAPGVQPEQMAYSTSPSLPGQWTYRGLLTGSARHGFTIHPSVNEFKGKWYLFYHDGCYPLGHEPGGDCRRHVCVEEIHFNPDGTIVPVTLTHKGLSDIAK